MKKKKEKIEKKSNWIHTRDARMIQYTQTDKQTTAHK
jgi:hypothetical protein